MTPAERKAKQRALDREHAAAGRLRDLSTDGLLNAMRVAFTARNRDAMGRVFEEMLRRVED